MTASILSAARDLFVAEGYQSVSIRKIAERIEYSPAAIYSYYPGKDDIFLALAAEGFHLLDEKVQSAMETDSPLENVRGCWWAFYEFSQEHPAYFLLMFVDQSVPRITQQWEGFEFLQQMLNNAVTAIQRAIDAGAFPKTLSPNAAMHMLWASLDRPGGRRHPPSPLHWRRLRRARARRAQRHHRRPPGRCDHHVRVVQVPCGRYRGNPGSRWSA